MPAAAPLLHKPKEETPRIAPPASAPPVSIVARSPTSIARSADPARSTIISPLSAQAKGFISSPGDASEREADRVADNVVAMPKPATRAKASNAAVARSIMRSPLIAQRAPSPANANAASAGQAAVAAEIKAAATGGFALPKKTSAFLEPRFKADFSKVMLHNDAKAKKLSSKIGARAFTYGRHIFFNEGQYNPDSKDGLKLLAHELTHTIQQSEAIQRKAEEAPRVTERTSKQASRLGISDVLDFFADAANAIPGYRMFTILIGVNPINMASVEASAANILRAIVEFLPGGNIITRVLDSYGVFDKVGGWIEGQLKSLGITGPAIKAALDSFTGELGFSDIFDLGGVWDRAKRIFTAPITRIIDFAKGLFAKILEFVQEAVLKPLAALAAQTPFYTLLKAVLGKDPVSGEKFEGGATEVIGGFMTMIGQEELWQNIQRANAIPRAFAWFKTAMKGLMGLVTSIPTRFIDGLKGLEIMDFVILPRAFIKIGTVLGSFLADFGSWALGTVIDLLKIIVEVVAPGVMPYIAKAAGAFNKILKDPISFVGNLIKAGKQGFNQFAGNFLTHLQASMVGWLTGAMAGANIYIPQGLSLREILKFVLSILGLTWQNIRAKLVRATNETTVVALETGFDIVRTLVTEGPAAAWQKILETLTNLQQMAIDAIKDFVKQRVVEAAVTRLLSMLSPVGAFIQAIIGMYNTFMFFKERLSQIATVVAGVIDGLDAIANGNTGPAANKVESTMAGGLTLVISFLARIAGLGRVADAVTGLIQRVRAPINTAIDRLVAWIVAQARRLGRVVMSGARRAVGGIRELLQRVFRRRSFSADGEAHNNWINEQGQAMVASEVMPLGQRLSGWRTRLSRVRAADRGEATQKLAVADQQHATISTKAAQVITAQRASNEAQITTLQGEIDAAYVILTPALQRLFVLFKDTTEQGAAIDAELARVFNAYDTEVIPLKSGSPPLITGAVTQIYGQLQSLWNQDRGWAYGMAQGIRTQMERVLEATRRVGTTQYPQLEGVEVRIPPYRRGSRASSGRVDYSVKQRANNTIISQAIEVKRYVATTDASTIDSRIATIRRQVNAALYSRNPRYDAVAVEVAGTGNNVPEFVQEMNALISGLNASASALRPPKSVTWRRI